MPVVYCAKHLTMQLSASRASRETLRWNEKGVNDANVNSRMKHWKRARKGAWAAVASAVGGRALFGILVVGVEAGCDGDVPTAGAEGLVLRDLTGIPLRTLISENGTTLLVYTVSGTRPAEVNAYVAGESTWENRAWSIGGIG